MREPLPVFLWQAVNLRGKMESEMIGRTYKIQAIKSAYIHLLFHIAVIKNL